jgi:hypothetical protein
MFEALWVEPGGTTAPVDQFSPNFGHESGLRKKRTFLENVEAIFNSVAVRGTFVFPKRSAARLLSAVWTSGERGGSEALYRWGAG